MKTATTMVLAGLLFAAMPGATAGSDQQICWIVNGTRATMVAVQIRPTGTREWRALDLHEPLGFNGRVQGPTITGRCGHYDIQVLFDDGHRVIKPRQTLCRPGTYKITDY